MMRRGRLAALTGLLLWWMTWATPVQAETRVLKRDAAAGGGVVMAGEWRLHATIGDGMVAGTVESGPWRLDSGFMTQQAPKSTLHLPVLFR